MLRKLSVLNELMKSMAVRGGWRLLLSLTLFFKIYLVWEILFLSGKISEGILKTEVCGNHARVCTLSLS